MQKAPVDDSSQHVLLMSIIRSLHFSALQPLQPLQLHKASDQGETMDMTDRGVFSPALMRRLPETPYGSVTLGLLSHFLFNWLQ